MKGSRFFFGMIAVAVMVFGYDKQEEEATPSISVSTSFVSFFHTGGGFNNQVVRIKATCDWPASCDAGWVLVSTSSGTASDNYVEASISAEGNDEDGSYYISYGDSIDV